MFCPTGGEAPGQTQDTLERLYLSTGIPPEELEEVDAEREVWTSLLRLQCSSLFDLFTLTLFDESFSDPIDSFVGSPRP